MATLDKIQAQAGALVAKQSSGVVAKIRDIMEKHGLTTADIEAHIGGAKKRGRKPSSKAAVKTVASVAKYRDPKSGATWTGRGRAPAWIANAKDRSRFLIDGSSAIVNVGAANKSKAAAKAPNKAAAKGKLPPKYRNPETGETWSGHARPPAWIKDVKDRTAFLIAGAGEGAVAPKAAAAKKAAPAKKTAAKKSATKKSVAKKASAKKVTPTAKKAPTKKTAVKKAAAKKVGAKKVVARKAVASSAPPAQAPAQAADSAGATTIA